VTYFSGVAHTIGRTRLRTIDAIGTIGFRHVGSDELREPTKRSHRWLNPGRCRRQGKEREPDKHKPKHHGGQYVAVDPHTRLSTRFWTAGFELAGRSTEASSNLAETPRAAPVSRRKVASILACLGEFSEQD
jgi:hypothetical protein